MKDAAERREVTSKASHAALSLSLPVRERRTTPFMTSQLKSMQLTTTAGFAIRPAAPAELHASPFPCPRELVLPCPPSRSVCVDTLQIFAVIF